jgi:hypothetical protein
MRKLISIVMFTLFASAAGASLANVCSDEPHCNPELSASKAPEAAPTTNVFDPVCTPALVACKADCSDLSGGALGACLRACNKEFEECMAQR